MCGIIGVLGNHEVAPLLVETLKRLEYRGYDSAGIATVHKGNLDRRRAVGKLINLSDELVHNPLAGKAGIGHTRWATHGEPSVTNAHPHMAGSVAVVHNGIIENFKALREELSEQGIVTQTETDTETIALLAQHYMSTGKSAIEAAQATIKRLEGAFALCFLFDGEEDLLIAARKGSPLVIGHGDGEMFVGSDAIAIGPFTSRVTYLEEGDWAIVRRSGAEIFTEDGVSATRAILEIKTSATQVDKAGHKHFMAKEIAEQPTVLADLLSEMITADGAQITLPADIDFTKYDRVLMVACGTGFIACQTAKYWFEQIARIPVEVDVASEFRYREPPIPARTLAVYLSQSGETADTLAALRYTAEKADTIAAVVNVPTSSIAREADVVFQINAGVEVSVASTKAFTNQLAIMAVMALKAAQDRGEIEAARMSELLGTLRTLPALFNQAFSISDAVQAVAQELSEARDILFLGRGAMYPIAMEGALKMKELSYIHAEGYASGELKHGPIALIDPNVPVVVMAPMDALFEKTVSNMQEVMARGGKVILITDAAGAKEASDGVWKVITLPTADPVFAAPILHALPVQLLAYHTAIAKGTDVDQPRNLAKSVTVE
jgi:glucosamine--fructose-6-phosphate aminotransferase (isomerizing)